MDLKEDFISFPPQFGCDAPRIFPVDSCGDQLEFFVLQHLLRVPQFLDYMCPPACFHARRIGEKKIDQGAVKAGDIHSYHEDEERS